MCEVSKSVKETLQSTVGCVSAESFHALVSCQQSDAAAAGHVTQQVPLAVGLLQQAPGDLAGAGAMSTFKAAATTSSSIAIQRMSLPNRYLTFDDEVVRSITRLFVVCLFVTM